MTPRAHPDRAEDQFERLAKGLLEYETLTGDEIRA
jgi:ATP-dependent Zn protease